MAEALLPLSLTASLSSAKKIITDSVRPTSDTLIGESIYTVNFNETFKYGLLIINSFGAHGLYADMAFSDPIIFLPLNSAERQIRMQVLKTTNLTGNASCILSLPHSCSTVGFRTSPNSLTFIAFDKVYTSYYIDYCITLY